VALGQTNEAIRAYERSLALNPQNTSATQALARMRQ
jgi:Tfp pilus assembly protein PilF